MAQLQQSNLMSFIAQQPPKTISGNSLQSNSTISIYNSSGSNLRSSAIPSGYAQIYKDVSGKDYVPPTNIEIKDIKQGFLKDMKEISGDNSLTSKALKV